MKNNIFKVYMSHTIMGAKGEDADDEYIKANLDRALWAGGQFKAHFLDWERMDGFPKIDLHVPAEYESFVSIAYKKKLLTIPEILEVDCAIIRGCDLLLVYGAYHSSGMKVEISYANKHKIPIYQCPGIQDEEAIPALRFAIQLLLVAESDRSVGGDEYESV